MSGAIERASDTVDRLLIVDPARAAWRPTHRASALGSFVTVLVAILVDLLAGEAPIHAVGLGLVVLSVIVARVLLVPACRAPWYLVNVCVMAQPALHAAGKLLPHPGPRHGMWHQVGIADLVFAAAQIAMAVMFIATVCFAEQIIALLTSRIRSCLMLSEVPTALRRQSPVLTGPKSGATGSHYRYGSIARRGPPPRMLVRYCES